MDLPIQPLGRVVGDLALPGDKSISHRVAFLAALADGPSCLRNFPMNRDCRSTLRVLSQLGISYEELEPGTVTVFGQGGSFQSPAEALDCGNSGTTARLLMGLLASQPFEAIIDGDASLRKRPMGHVIAPLREMGAEISFLDDKGCLPIWIRGSSLRGKTLASPVASAQLKSAILLAGLQAHGVTSVTEALPTRDHTERTLSLADIEVALHDNAIFLPGGQVPRRFDVTIPGDISSAAFWMALAAPHEDSRMILRDVSLNRHRLGFVDALVHMGAGVREEVIDCGDWEWHGHLDVRGGPLRPFHATAEMIPSLVDEIPVLAVMAAKAEGISTIRGASDLRSKETDRISAIADNLKRMGVEVEEYPDGLAIHGTGRLCGAELESFGDHRIAMAFAIAGSLAEGESLVRDAECISISYPEFQADLNRIAESSKIDAAPIAETIVGNGLSGAESWEKSQA